jgi:hypothetical protein
MPTPWFVRAADFRIPTIVTVCATGFRIETVLPSFAPNRLRAPGETMISSFDRGIRPATTSQIPLNEEFHGWPSTEGTVAIPVAVCSVTAT